MHIFVYETPRHRQSRYSHQRYQEHVINGQFDIEKLRKGLASEYKIWGFGTHKVHQVLRQLDLASEMKGHLIELEDPKKAVWLRLNYDLVGRPGTDYKGLYRDIDLSYLEAKSVEYQEVMVNYTRLIGINSKLSSSARNLDALQMANILDDHRITPDFRDEFFIFHEKLTKEWESIEQQRDSHQRRAEAIKNEVKDYLESKKA